MASIRSAANCRLCFIGRKAYLQTRERGRSGIVYPNLISKEGCYSTQIFTVNIGRESWDNTLFVVVPTKCFSTGP